MFQIMDCMKVLSVELFLRWQTPGSKYIPDAMPPDLIGCNSPFARGNYAYKVIANQLFTLAETHESL